MFLGTDDNFDTGELEDSIGQRARYASMRLVAKVNWVILELGTYGTSLVSDLDLYTI